MIEHKIVYREFPPGSLLPSERKLGEQLKVNRMTIVRVYEELLAAGLIERKQGSGTRVSTSKWGMLHSGTTNWKSYVEGGTFLPMLPLIKRIKQEANSVKDIYDLAGGDLPTDLSPSSLLVSFLKDITEVDTGFEHVQGQLLLRETIAHYMKELYNINATSSSIIVTTGIQQSIYLITQCLLSPGDAIAIESPSYIYSFPLFQSTGLRVFGLPVDENGINPEDIITLYRKHRIKFIFLNPTYQNPTRTVLSENRWKRIAEIAAELNIPISEGDSYNPYLL
ncbi:PLP-dependent aminotransferase family protein [Metabacillus litoralis]|nr:PLP-dependent aminotransferase family protein [Metabacillus litoralis]